MHGRLAPQCGSPRNLDPNRLKRMRLPVLIMMISLGCMPAVSQEHSHEDHGASTPKIAPPTVFLDKSPRIVEYQLNRLDNQRLLLVERKTDDEKYIPVFQAILSRVGMTPQFREEAIAALVKLTDSSPVGVLLETIERFDIEDRDQRRAARQLGAMLLRQPDSMLTSETDSLVEASSSDHSLVRSVALAAMITSNQIERVIDQLEQGGESKLAFLSAIEMVPNAKQRSVLREQVVDLAAPSQPTAIRRAAISSLGFIGTSQDETFQMLAPLVTDDKLRNAAVKTLLKIPPKQRDEKTSADILNVLVTHAEDTPAEDRTSDAFIDAMQLADQLMSKVAANEAREFRQRLSEVTVRVVRIKTVEEEMRYDTPYFAVEAGKSVQIVLENHDLMPHNLVITTPGSLKEVAQLGLAAGPEGGWKGLAYVPESDKVLHATEMVAAEKQTRLTFTAPTQPGEYPYVCTFPQHWYRMYGVMVVTENLDEWLKNPVEPANPIGSNRTFVQAWTVEELKDELDTGLRGRSPEIGQKIFVEASCAGCHKVTGEGGIIGPDLTDVVSRWKGDRVGVLREILDPSHKVDAKYAMQRILTVDGRTLTGVLIKEDDDNVMIMTNPEAKEPTVIPQDDIDAMVPSSVSMMPKALMDQYTKDEIFEMMAYLESVDPKKD